MNLQRTLCILCILGSLAACGLVQAQAGQIGGDVDQLGGSVFRELVGHVSA